MREEKKNKRLVRRGALLLSLLRRAEKMRKQIQQGGSCCLAGGWRENPNKKGGASWRKRETLAEGSCSGFLLEEKEEDLRGFGCRPWIFWLKGKKMGGKTFSSW